MRALPVAALLAACAATPEKPLGVCWPVRESHERTWQAACRAGAT